MKTPQNIFKNLHFKFQNFFYVLHLLLISMYELRKDLPEQPSRIIQLESETLAYLGGYRLLPRIIRIRV